MIKGKFSTTTASTTITLQNLTDMTTIDWGDGTIDSNLTHTYTDIGDYEFIAEGVTAVGYSAFVACTDLAEITFDSNVVSISSQAFNSCIGLREVIFPISITSIGSEAFLNCINISSFIFQGTTPPTLGTNGLTHTANIYVNESTGHTVLTAYKTAWPLYASKIYELTKVVVQINGHYIQDTRVDDLDSKYVSKTGDTLSGGLTVQSASGFYGIENTGTGTDLNTKYELSEITKVTSDGTYNISLPNETGTLAIDEDVVHLAEDETITGDKTFTSSYGVTVKNSSNRETNYTANQIASKIDDTTSYVYTFPIKSGKLALDDDIPDIDTSIDSSSTDTKVPSSKCVYDNVKTKIDQKYIAAEYDNTMIYSLNMLCTHDGKLYQCGINMTEAEEWDESHWGEITADNYFVNTYLDQTINGVKTFNNASGVVVKKEDNTVATSYGPNEITKQTYNGGALEYTYKCTLPNSSGTLVLGSDLNDYLKVDGTNNIEGVLTTEKQCLCKRDVDTDAITLLGGTDSNSSVLYLAGKENSSLPGFMLTARHSDGSTISQTSFKGLAGGDLTWNDNQVLTTADIIDNLTSTSTTDALSANQGKALKASIDAMAGVTSTLVVSALPSSPAKNTFYYVGTASPYHIYFYDSTGTQHDFGTTSIDLSEYLKLSGGEMTGQLVLNSGEGVCARGSKTDSFVQILGGTTKTSGAYIHLFGKDYANGNFSLRACDGTTTTGLTGTAAGGLIWGNNDISGNLITGDLTLSSSLTSQGTNKYYQIGKVVTVTFFAKVTTAIATNNMIFSGAPNGVGKNYLTFLDWYQHQLYTTATESPSGIKNTSALSVGEIVRGTFTYICA